MDDTKFDEAMDVDVNSMLECQLLEDPTPNKECEVEQSSEKEEMSNGFTLTLSNIQGTISPRHVYAIEEGTMPAVPENLISHVKISPTFSKIKSRSLQYKFPAVSTSPNEYLLWKLKEEKYLEDPIRWLIEKRIIPIPSICRHHHGVSIFRKGSNVTWRCGSCRLIHPVVLPALYRKFENFEISDLLAVTIHWACQSDLSSVMSDCGIDVDEIFHVWSHLQQVCSSSLKKSKISNSTKKNCDILEGAAFQFGEFLIVGVYERNTKFSHLEAIPFERGWNMDGLSNAIEPILKACTFFNIFVSDCILFKNIVERFNLNFMLTDPNITDPKNPGFHNLNIRHYVIRFLHTNFSVFDSKSLQQRVFQSYLDELQWRERFGHTSQMAFWNMLYRIAREVVEKSDTLPKRMDEETDIMLKSDFDSAFPHQVYEPPFPLIIMEKENPVENLPSNNGTARESNVSGNETDSAELILPSVETEDGVSKLLNESKTSSTEVEEDVNSVEIIEDESFDAFCENMTGPSGKEFPDLARLDGQAVRFSLGDVSTSSEDISGYVMFMMEGFITLTISNLLSIQTWPFILKLKGYEDASEEMAEKDVDIFKKRLIEEGFFTKPVPWMVTHHMVQENALCVCGNNRFFLREDMSSSEKFVWMCSNKMCCIRKPYRRLKFFSLFAFSMKDILHLMYHWSVQTKVEDMRSLVNLNEYKIRYVYWAIQRVCSRIMILQNPTLGGYDHIVEVSMVQFGQYCIIGAFDRETTLTRLRAVQTPKTYTANLVESVVAQWLEPSTIVVTSYNKCLYFINNRLVEMTSHNIVINTALISRCLHLLVKNLFGKFSTAGLKQDMIQAFLDEIQWRERYGIVPEAAFWSLFHQIAKDENIDINSSKRAGLPQICQVGVIPSEVFRKSDNYSFSDVKITEQDVEKTPHLISEESCNGFMISSVSSLPPESHVEEFDDQLNEDEEPSTTEENGDSNEMPYPGVTLLSEKDLELDYDEEMETEEEHSDPTPNSPQFEFSKDIWDCCTLTLDWSSLKTLKPMISDCMSFLKLAKKKDNCLNDASKDESDVKYYALDEYYFARKKPTKISVPERTYVYCCTLCKLYLFSNISVIEHTMLHAEEKRRETIIARNVVNCPYCLMEICSKETMEQHVKLVHESGSSLTCLICSQYYPTVAMLNAHMKFSHVPCEMPYSCSLCNFRSSLHKEVLDHFKEAHECEPHLICPFCLKICSPRAKTDEVLYTQTYCQHLIKHQQGKHNSSCPSCGLTFIAPADVQVHFMKDHVSFLNTPGIAPFKPRQNPVIVTKCRPDDSICFPSMRITSLHVLPALTEKTQVYKNSMELSASPPLLIKPPVHPPPVSVSISTESQLPSLPEGPIIDLQKELSSNETLALMPPPQKRVSLPITNHSLNSKPSPTAKVNEAKSCLSNTDVEEKLNNFVKYNIGPEYKCMECGNKPGKNHFYKLLSCYCNYSTHCANAFVNHMMQRHGVLKKHAVKNVIQPRQLLFQKDCPCSCGFSSNNGNVLANHLRKCSGHIDATGSKIAPDKKETASENSSASLLLQALATITTEPQCSWSNKTPSNLVVPAPNPPPVRTTWLNGPHSGLVSSSYPMLPGYSEALVPSTSNSLLGPPTRLYELPTGYVVQESLTSFYGGLSRTVPLNHQIGQVLPVNDSALNALLQSPRFSPYNVPARSRLYSTRTDMESSPVPSVPHQALLPHPMFHSGNASGAVSHMYRSLSIEPSHGPPFPVFNNNLNRNSADISLPMNRIERFNPSRS